VPALPPAPAPTGGAFQATPAKAVPDVPAAGGPDGSPSAESSGHDGPGDGDSGHDRQESGHQNPAPAAPAPAPPGTLGCTPSGTPAATDTSAATWYGWGAPSRVDDFDTALGSNWSVYDGPGHNGAGRRTPDSIMVDNGIMTMTGDAQGNSGGMAWQPGQRYGRWEARVRSPAGDPDYHAVLLLWPDAENWPVGGEVDFMEISDPTRQTTQMFLHYGQDNQQVQGSVDIDATQWHDWAVEWSPTGVTAYVDGKAWWSTTDISILPPGPMHLCIQLDNFGGTSMEKTSMEVDWVKEYKIGSGTARTAEGALDAVGSVAGGLVAGGLVEGGLVAGGLGAGGLGAADAVGQVARPLTEGAPDPVPAVPGLVRNAVQG
jgi:hypothetical protein